MTLPRVAPVPVTETPGAPVPDAYASTPVAPAAPSHYGGPLPVLQERNFGIALLLTIVTFGVYHYVWHYLTHDELSRQMGRENKATPLLFAYISIAVVSTILSVILQVMQATMAEPETLEQAFAYLETLGPWLLVSLVLSITNMVLFVLYVSKQWELLREAKARTGLQLRGSAGLFFLLYFGSVAIVLFFFWLIVPLIAPLIMVPIAYYHLNENYNDLARALRSGQIDPGAYRPGGQGWTHGPLRPPTGGPAPVSAAFAPAYFTQTPYHQQAPSTTYGGLPTSSWDAPSAPASPTGPFEQPPAAPPTGFSVRARTEEPQAEPSGPIVEQSFQCPRCHMHVTARGAPGTLVPVQCPRCGEAGDVHLPHV